MQMPHDFFAKEAQGRARHQAARAGRVRRRHGLPAGRRGRARTLRAALREGRRAKKARPSSAGATCRSTTAPLGPTAGAVEPVIRQVFVGAQGSRTSPTTSPSSASCTSSASCVENAVRRLDIGQQRACSTCRACRARRSSTRACSCPTQVPRYYPDLRDPAVETALALVHSRFSTNTFPSWDRAHPYRYLCHNGEINTLRGNVNWMHARESMFASELFGDDLKKTPARSSTRRQRLGHVRQRPGAAGADRPLAAARHDDDDSRAVGRRRGMSPEKKAFYEYHSCLMEPWDGPASIAFTDGIRDRRRARPQRPAARRATT